MPMMWHLNLQSTNEKNIIHAKYEAVKQTVSYFYYIIIDCIFALNLIFKVLWQHQPIPTLAELSLTLKKPRID